MDNIGGQWHLAAQNKRKEKARIAARARRSQEANIIMEMASELQITQEKMRRVDKATIVKLAIDYLKAFDILCGTAASSNQLDTPTTIISNNNPNIVLSNEPEQQQQQREDEQLHSILDINDVMPNDDDDQDEIRNISNIENEYIIDHASIIRNENLSVATKHQHQEENDDDEQQDLLQQQQQQIGQQRILSSLELPTKILKLETTNQTNKRHQQLQHQQREIQHISLHSNPTSTTSSIFSPKTLENSNEHYLMIEHKDDGKSDFVLKPETEISDEDDLTHLAPQAGEMTISLDATAATTMTSKLNTTTSMPVTTIAKPNFIQPATNTTQTTIQLANKTNMQPIMLSSPILAYHPTYNIYTIPYNVALQCHQENY